MATSFGTGNKTAAEVAAFRDAGIKQAPYIHAFFAEHEGHNVIEFDVQDSTVIRCEDCDDYIMVN